MFRTNDGHCQLDLFGFLTALPEAKAKRLRASWAGSFYELVFSRIDERMFSVLFDRANGRPNAPVNCLVGSIVLQQYFGWSCEELFERLDFDLRTRLALGLGDLESSPFSASTYFLFRQRLLRHSEETGTNLLESVFDHLTREQLERLGVRTDVQRSDSFQAMSNIRSYSRVQLLVEVLIRLHGSLGDVWRERVGKDLEAYVSVGMEHYVHRLGKSDIPRELERLAVLYHRLHGMLSGHLAGEPAFDMFARVFGEHFEVGEDGVRVRPDSELGSRALQSPDDPDATYHRKRGRAYRGRGVNVTETAHPDNPAQIITDVSVGPNADSDSAVLNERLPKMREKTPDLDELHTDGAYGSPANDAIMDECGITHAVTGVKGVTARVPIRIEPVGPGSYSVSCPHQTVPSSPTPKRHKAVFDPAVCATCELREHCPARLRSAGRTHYFTHAEALASTRAANIGSLPPERRTIRANVEATVKRFTRAFNHKGKLRVRGHFATLVYALGTAIGINFDRVRRALGRHSGPEPAVSARIPAKLLPERPCEALYGLVRALLPVLEPRTASQASSRQPDMVRPQAELAPLWLAGA